MMRAFVMNSKSQNFRSDQSGFAAVEFALFLPIFLILILGGVSIFDIVRANSRLDAATAAIVDVATRLNEINAGRIDDFLLTLDAILETYGDDSVAIAVSSVINSSNDRGNDLTVAWSQTRGDIPRLTNSDLQRFNMPNLLDGESVIIVQTEVNYSPPVSVEYIPMSFLLESVSIRSPRFRSQICFDLATHLNADNLVCG